MLNDGQTLGNCGFTNQTARPQAPATVGLAFRLSGEYFTLLSVWVSVVIAAPLSLFSVVALCVLSFSQMIRLSSWGSSRSPLPQSSLTSWSPKTRAAQPMSRLSSEGGDGRKEGELARGWGGQREDARAGLGEGVNFGGVMPQQVSFILLRTDLQLGRNSYNTGSPCCKFEGGFFKEVLKPVNACLINWIFHTRPFRDTWRTCHNTVSHSWDWLKAENKELYLVFN